MALSQGQIARLWINQGGDPKYANVMSRIALRESGGRAKINNRGTNSNGTVDWGLFQVNDIWRRDPVVGKLFRSGAILTPQGSTQAAIHILKVQGPKAWATYNPSVDAKYIGRMTGGTSGTSGTVRKAKQAATPSVAASAAPDQLAQRSALISQYLSSEHQPGALTGLASGLLGLQQEAKTATAPSAPTAPSSPKKSPRRQQQADTSQGGLANFDGHQVAAWIAPALQYARQHGWHGTIASGYRTDAEQTRIYKSGVRPAALPQSMGGGGSNHEFKAYPGGAVDVTNAAQLAAILRRSPYANKLIWAGSKDPVHFSHPHNGAY